MDHVGPSEIVSEAVAAAGRKANLAVKDLMLRGILAGAFLGYATSLALVIVAQGVAPIVAAALFPVGFVMLVLLGLELATGNFALLPAALMAGEVGWIRLVRNWAWVYLGNLLGSLLYAALFYLAITNWGTSNGGALGDQIRQLAQKKTLAYAALGASGWAAAMVKGILCNWMVTLGAVLAFASRSTVGKIVAMWLPIMTFFALGFEHSVVNMFVVPAGIVLGAPVSTGQWWIWNQLPVTLGNVIGGVVFTGAALYLTHGQKPDTARRREAAASVELEILSPPSPAEAVHS